jgi:NosR/NirI family nitrous oxide reductase transcriptional regulator
VLFANKIKRIGAAGEGVADHMHAFLARLALVSLGILLAGMPAYAADMEDPLDHRIAGALETVFPDATRIGDISGTPPVAEVFIDDELVGYVFSTFDTAPIGGFTGVPFDLVVGMDLEARVRGVSIVEHHEPIISHNAIPEIFLVWFFEQLSGFKVDGSLRAMRATVDGVSGATVSSELMRSSIIASARKIAARYGMIETDTDSVSVDLESFQYRDWSMLIDDGSVARTRIEWSDVAERAGVAVDAEKAGSTFLEAYAALATPAGIGRNFFGDSWHSFHLSELDAKEHLVVIASNGAHQLLGKRPRGSEPYAETRIVQDGRVMPLSLDNKLGKPSIIPDGAPFLSERAMFRLGPRDQFDPLKPWTLEFEVPASRVGGEDGADPIAFTLPYILPPSYVTGSDHALEEAGYKEPSYVVFGLLRESLLNDWQRVWVARVGDIAILACLLGLLTLLMLFQDRIAPNRQVFVWLRAGFLAFVLVWLGWMMDAQLTTLNIVTYAQTLISGMDLAPILLDPLIFFLTVYVLITLLIWGRGVFCGWLCPFGALQELSNHLARWLRVPQIAIPEAVNERAWALKYVFAVIICALSVWSIDAAQTAAEVEPFKTAIVVGFDRDWPYLVYAGILLVVGLSVERFFCRYLCPLGGALGLLGRWHVMRWLNQRPECGDPCAVCRRSCPVDAIATDGAINMNECFQCMDCQLEFFDDTACPPLVRQRKQAQRGLAA